MMKRASCSPIRTPRRVFSALNSGLSLLEVLIALAILTLVLVALMRLQQITVKGTQQALDQSTLARTLFLVQSDIVKDDRFLPAQEIPADADPFDARTFDKYLDNPDMAFRRCYNRFGSEVKDPDPQNQDRDCAPLPGVFFTVQYVKFRQPDVTFYANPANPTARPDNELNRIPLAQYRLRVDYATEGRSRRLFLSRFVTSAVAY